MDKPVIGITSGDLNGIGLELIIKIFSDVRMLDICTPIVFGSNKSINFYRKLIAEPGFKFHSLKSIDEANPKMLNILNCWEEEVEIHPGQLNSTGGAYAIKSFKLGVEALKNKEIDALVTAPIHKSNTQGETFEFTGHTPYLKHAFEVEDVVMMLYNQQLRVALITEHIPISKVAATITKELMIKKIMLIQKSLKKDFLIDQPKIAILGLNPHAGDEGTIGEEELNIITPAIDTLQKQHHVLAFGPYSPDAFFARGAYKQFDVVVAMYHDQGLIPFKTIAVDNGINYTMGLPAIRTSPDHGVAFDIAGKNLANPESMQLAIFEAIDRIKCRNQYLENTANPLKRSRLSNENA